MRNRRLASSRPAVETEDQAADEIRPPYDPSKIRVDHQNVNLGTIIEMLEFNEIDLMTDFQRKEGLWNNTQKSQLIESILLGLPLPSFYFSVDELTGRWSVVDGLQRLSTLNEFIVKRELKLTGLEFLESYIGRTFKDFTREDIRKISGFKINLYLIDRETPHDVKFLIFRRVNSGGLVLSPQEMRHALNQGKPARFVMELACLESFKIATGNKIKPDRQEDRDYVTRFISFYLLGYEDNYGGELNTFMNRGMALLNQKSDQELKEIEIAFSRSMELAYKIFNKTAFRKTLDLSSKKRYPLSKSIFDTVSVNLAWLSCIQQEILLNKGEEVVRKLNYLYKQNDDFYNSVSVGTGKRRNVYIRFTIVKNLFKEILGNDTEPENYKF